jgi:hypothetical protein
MVTDLRVDIISTVCLLVLVAGSFRTNPGPARPWFIFGLSAVAAAWLAIQLSGAQDARPDFKLGWLIKAIVLLDIVFLFISRFLKTVRASEDQLVAVILVTATLPFLLLDGVKAGLFDIFGANCASPRVSDFAWFTLDCLAKGGLGDLMESFNIDIFQCKPRKDSAKVSIIIFGIRTFATIVVAWLIVQAWRRARYKI